MVFAWFQYRGIPLSAPVSRVSGPQAQGTLLSLLGSLQGLRFDVSFFENRLYKSLEDITPDISLPEIKGRSNPFAPL